MENDIKMMIRNNVITTVKAAEILQVSKQTVSDLVKNSELEPVLSTTQGTMFLRSEVEELYRKRCFGSNPLNRSKINPIFFQSGATDKNVEFFYKNKDKFSSASAIYIFFHEFDSILNNFYQQAKGFYYGELQRVDTPHMIIKNDNLEELWLAGCNCGYGGTGPHGTERILKEYGIKDEDINEIFSNRVVKYFKNENDEWEVHSHDSELKDMFKNEVSAGIYLFRNQLALIQDYTYKVSIDAEPERIIEKYRAFIPNPIEVVIMNKEQAQLNGFVAPGYFQEEHAYRLIMKDATGRQLWLDTDIDDEKPLYKQNNVVQFLKYCGFELDTNKKLLSETMLSWLNITPRKTSLEPISIKRKL